MTGQIALLLSIVLIAVILFSVEWVSADVVALGILIALVLTGLLPVEQAFSGFGSDTALMLLGLMILSAALVQNGVVDAIGRAILRLVGKRTERLLLVIIASVSILSAFISNTSAVAVFLPLVIGLARRVRINASRLLMPLAFAAILASSVTLISTSTNLVVSGMLRQFGLAPISMFELTPVGLPIVIIGLAYLLTLGRRLSPNNPAFDTLSAEFDLRAYITEVVVLPASPFVGKTLSESKLGHDLDLTVLRVMRAVRSESHSQEPARPRTPQTMLPQANLTLAEGDILLVEGTRDDILKIKTTTGLDLAGVKNVQKPAAEFAGAEQGAALGGDQPGNMLLAELIILPRSFLIGRTLRGVNFRQRFGLQVLAIQHREQTLHRKLSQMPLGMGDILLVQGTRPNIAALQDNQNLRVLSTVEPNGSLQTASANASANTRKMTASTAIFLGVMTLAAFGLLPLAVAVLTGVLLVFVTRCITPEEAYRQVEWKIYILIGSMLALGSAMQATGAADFLAEAIVKLTESANPLWLLAAFFTLTVLLTQPMSNQAAAAVVLPVAIQTAVALGLNPRPFAMIIAIAASTSYLTPLEPACLLVYGPGHYRFMDFFKVGAPLTLFIFAIAMLLVPLLWPLR